jgi:hypothetical protein
MKRATTVTLLCMGAGAFFVANAYENSCVANNAANAQKNNADWSDTGGAARPTPAPDTPCRSGGYSHYYSSSHYYGGSSSSGFGFASSGVSRGGFGGSGHHSGS